RPVTAGAEDLEKSRCVARASREVAHTARVEDEHSAGLSCRGMALQPLNDGFCPGNLLRRRGTDLGDELREVLVSLVEELEPPDLGAHRLLKKLRGVKAALLD